VRGDFTAAQALAQMLEGSGIEAVQVAGEVFRLQPRRLQRDAPAGRAPALTAELAEVLVTAAKRQQPMRHVPVPLTLVPGDALDRAGGMGGSRAALAADASASSTGFGPGLDRHFIRGIADSPFLGPSQATVSLQFDEARLNYSAPDPDLRLLDIDRVEILKGPQGPLYGTGALGGVIHIVPHRPDLAAAAFQSSGTLAAVAHGGLSRGISAVMNLPLVEDRLAMRTVAYAADEAGWIDNLDGRTDANRTRLRGGRLAVRARAGDWVADVHGVAQRTATRDSQYVTGSGGHLWRSGTMAEPRAAQLYLVGGTLRGPLGDGELVLASSYVNQELQGDFDASAAATAFGVMAPATFRDDRTWRLVTAEARATGGQRIAWLAGAAMLSAHSLDAGMLLPAPASGARVLDLKRDTLETAVFGELAVPLARRWRLTTGARLARVADEDERRGGAGTEQEAEVVHTLTPSLSLDWTSADGRRFWFLRFAQAIRPGGLNPDDDEDERRFRSDELSSLDLGTRMNLAGDRLLLQATLFATHWQHVQSDYLLDNGLVGTRNIGPAGNVGIEMQAQWLLPGDFVLGASATWQHARLEDAPVPLASHDPRMPVVPDQRARVSLARQHRLGSWSADWVMSADFTGASRLSFEPGLDRRMPARFAMAAGAGVARDGWAARLEVANLLDSRADAFAYGNPFSVRTVEQRTPLQPRTVTLQLTRRW